MMHDKEEIDVEYAKNSEETTRCSIDVDANCSGWDSVIGYDFDMWQILFDTAHHHSVFLTDIIFEVDYQND